MSIVSYSRVSEYIRRYLHVGTKHYERVHSKSSLVVHLTNVTYGLPGFQLLYYWPLDICRPVRSSLVDLRPAWIKNFVAGLGIVQPRSCSDLAGPLQNTATGNTNQGYPF
jgi:hypothetical protein